MSPALLWSLLALTATAGSARAHRLEAEYRVLPGRKVQVESWFDLTGDSPKGARVQVLRPDGRTLTEGKLDGQGVFVFSYGEPEALKVVVNAGAGHRKELEIPARELAPSSPAGAGEKSRSAAPGSSPEDGAAKPFADRSPRVSVKDVLTGVGFLLALAAFVLSLRNARQLRELRQAMHRPADQRAAPQEQVLPLSSPTGQGYAERQHGEVEHVQERRGERMD